MPGDGTREACHAAYLGGCPQCRRNGPFRARRCSLVLSPSGLDPTLRCHCERGRGPGRCAYHHLRDATASGGDPNKEYTVSETATPTASYLTQEAFDRLKAELDQMSGEGRTEIAKKIEAARDEGDLKENGGYHAAKEEQGKMEARIRQLTQLLENAIVGAKPADDGIVEPGMVVTVEMFGDDVTFLLGSREIAG